jgi:hypothetical protein
MADMMTFPNTVEEFMEQYKITDTEQIYTNGAELVPIFRMRQWFDHKPEQHEIGYSECASAMLKMWIDEVLTDGEYNRIMDKLNAYWVERREE